jgi:hypothetical protein
MSSDPLAILDSPKVEADEPLPFTDEDDARHIKLMADMNERLGDAYAKLGAAAEDAAEALTVLQLVRCAGCKRLFKGDSALLQDAELYASRSMLVAEHITICASCAEDIETDDAPRGLDIPPFLWSSAANGTASYSGPGTLTYSVS